MIAKAKLIRLMAVIFVHALGIYALTCASIASVERKAVPVIRISMVTLQEAKPPKVEPVMEEKKQILSVQKEVVPQAIVEAKQPVSLEKSTMPIRVSAPVAVPTLNPVVEAPMMASKQELPITPAVVQKPVVLSGDLSVSCPVRTAPKYPRISLKMDEEGNVVVRVKLDKEGKITEASVKSSSGYRRLDDAAILAVQTWKCHPAMRDNVAVEAYALQPFEFNVEGN